MALSPELPVQRHAVSQPLGHPSLNVLGAGVQLLCSPGPRFGRMASGEFPASSEPAPEKTGVPENSVPAIPRPRRFSVWSGRPFHFVDPFHLSHLQQSLSDTSTKTS